MGPKCSLPVNVKEKLMENVSGSLNVLTVEVDATGAFRSALCLQ